LFIRVNPSDFSIQKTLGVYNEYGYQNMLNELEYVDGKIFANIYLLLLSSDNYGA
jgi:glutamine cyclotransferase